MYGMATGFENARYGSVPLHKSLTLPVSTHAPKQGNDVVRRNTSAFRNNSEAFQTHSDNRCFRSYAANLLFLTGCTCAQGLHIIWTIHLASSTHKLELLETRREQWPHSDGQYIWCIWSWTKKPGCSVFFKVELRI